MDPVPEFDYQTLRHNGRIEDLQEFRLRLTPSQAAALKRAEERTLKYQVSEALNDNPGRSARVALNLMFWELWGMLRYPYLSSVRGLFFGGRVSSTQYESQSPDVVVVHIKTKGVVA